MEADVIGVKIKETEHKKRTLVICHVEIGSLTRDYKQNIKTIREKFSDIRMNSIKERYMKRVGAVEDVQYEKIYVDIWASNTKAKKLSNEMNKESTRIWTMGELYSEVFRTMYEWKAAPGYSAKIEVTLPEGCWMLKLLEDLKRRKLLAAVKR